jgi:hypothetical protein
MPGGLATNYWFEYGPTTAYGSTTSTQNIAAGNTITAVTFALTGATPTTHYRLVAQNDSGTTRGINQTFMTLSSNADLSSLTLSSGTLSPTFASSTLSYTATVSHATSTLSLTPTSANIFATITVQGASVISGTPSSHIPLVVGSNVINTIVTAQDGTPKTYILTVTRESAYTDWITTTGIAGGGSALKNDLDFDGMPNLLEWAFGLNPTQGGNNSLQVSGGVLTARGGPSSSGSEGARVAIFARRLNHATAGLIYTVEFSANLSLWEPSTAIPTPIANDGEIEAVSVPYPAMVNGQPTKFFRVVVTGT